MFISVCGVFAYVCVRVFIVVCLYVCVIVSGREAERGCVFMHVGGKPSAWR